MIQTRYSEPVVAKFPDSKLGAWTFVSSSSVVRSLRGKPTSFYVHLSSRTGLGNVAYYVCDIFLVLNHCLSSLVKDRATSTNAQEPKIAMNLA